MTELHPENCTRICLENFPQIFTYPEENYGITLAALTSFFIALYAFLGFAIVCEEYLTSAMVEICYRLDITIVMADATLLAFGTSLPEFCICIISVNLARTDVGYCTIIGSVAFDSFAVVGLCALIAREPLALDWWTTSRDFGSYSLAVIISFIFMLISGDLPSFIPVLIIIFYVTYLIYLNYDAFIQEKLRNTDEGVERTGAKCFRTRPDIVPHIREKFIKYEEEESVEVGLAFHPFHWPTAGAGIRILWIISWPLQVLFILTIPDCRRKHFRTCYGLTVLMSIIWVVLLSYIVTWCSAVLTYYLRLPTSIVGLTLLAIGSAMPDFVSCIMMVHQANSARGVYYAWSINNIKMLLYLGIAYMVEDILGLLWPTKFTGTSISVHVIYMTASICFGFFIVYLLLLCTNFVINRWLGFMFILIYFAYITICCFIQFEWFKEMNKPFCVQQIIG